MTFFLLWVLHLNSTLLNLVDGAQAGHRPEHGAKSTRNTSSLEPDAALSLSIEHGPSKGTYPFSGL